MKRTTVVTLSLVLATLLSSCGSRTETELDYTKVTTPAALAADAELALGTKYDTFTVACTVPDTSAFAEQYYHINYTAEECGEDVLPFFTVLYEKDNYQISLGNNGPWIFSASSFYTLKMGQNDFVKRYRISDSTDMPTDSYSIDGVDYSINDAIALSEEYFSELADLIPADEVRPRTVIVFQPKDQEVAPEIKPGEYVYLLYFELIKDGLPLNQNCEMWSPDIPFFRSSYISVEITKAGEISRIEARYTLDITSETVYEDGILPLSYALDSANSSLAQYSNYAVSSVELDYTTLTWQWDKTTFYYEPWWCIRVAESNRIETGHGLDPVTVVYVNAITGETYLQSNIYGSEAGMELYLENPEWDPETNPESQWRVKARN